MFRRSSLLLVATVALALASGAAGAGPSLPAVDTGAGVATSQATGRFLTRLSASATTLEERRDGRLLRTATIPGRWGIQLVTLQGTLTGLSPNGRVLVLSDDVAPTGSLRAESSFAVIDTRTLALTKTVALRGDYSVDALSPNGRMLYLIHHLAGRGGTSYQVRAYDLSTGGLLPGAIADREQAGWIMSGYPVARATGGNGKWVYTLYQQSGAYNYPFIHALDTVDHTATCIGLPVDWTTNTDWISSAKLQLSARMLAIRTEQGKTQFVLDTNTFRVTRE
jgi:hypothetical protein